LFLSRTSHLLLLLILGLSDAVAAAAAAADDDLPAPAPAPVVEPVPSPPPPRRGPAEIRDEHVLAQPRLTLPALSPDTLGSGVTELRAALLWSNSFGWTQDVPGEAPHQRSFLVDGETASVDLTYRRGISDDVDVGARLPLRWRGGGVLDGLIDWYHGLVGLRGNHDGDRPLFVRDAFRVEGLSTTGRAFSWNGDTGFGLGDVELEARWRFHRSPDGLSTALAARVGLPTGTRPFEGNGVSLGLQALGARRLGRAWDVFFGLGGTIESSDRVLGVGYEPVRGHVFVAFEWHLGRSWSLVAETNAATRLISDIARYPGGHWLVNVGAKLDLSDRTRLELGFTENLMDQLSTTDFAVHAGIVLRP
jgi:Protein of unknown function (DUF3187)